VTYGGKPLYPYYGSEACGMPASAARLAAVIDDLGEGEKQ
jgi:hypothetical protein